MALINILIKFIIFNMLNIINFIFHYLFFMWMLPMIIFIGGLFNKNFNYTYFISILKNYLDFKINYIKEEKKINGFIFANHRSWADFPIDYSITNNVISGRYLGGFAMGIITLLLLNENRVVFFKRGSANRKYIYDLMKKKIKKDKPILIFPEGTRLKYTHLESKEDIKKKLKKGLIKEIYERNEYPVQIQITSNKEKVVDEKKLIFNKGITVNTALSKGIHPKDYNSFEEFLDKISEEWYELWRITHL